jgi:tetratricopeptide (TPR) repeat protein/transglutaminase-like putative cysteine protease
MSYRYAFPYFVLALLVAGACRLSAAAEMSPGWKLLTANKDSEARAAFKAALQRDPTDAEALRGLGRLASEREDPMASLENWRLIYKYHPGDWSATALWPEMVSAAEKMGRFDILEAAAHDVLASKASAPQLRASAQLVLADAAVRTGKFEQADTAVAGLRYIRKWEVIGPFDNISRSGYEKVFPPETAIDLKASCAGKDDLPLVWHPLAMVSRTGECRVAASLGDQGSDAYYAVTAVYSDGGRQAAAQFTPVGASKVFVNGRLVFADPVNRKPTELTADLFGIPVSLHAGWNTVLVKLADERSTTSAFSLRLTAPDGSDLAPLRADPVHAEGAQMAAPATDKPTDGGVEPQAVTLLRKAVPDDPETLSGIVERLRDCGDHAASADAARAGLVGLPDYGWLRWQLSLTLTSDDQVDDARIERDTALKDDAGLAFAQVDALGDKEDSLAPSELMSTVKALHAQLPRSSTVWWTLAFAYQKLNMNNEGIKAAREAEADAPGADGVVRLVSFLDDSDRKTEGQKVLQTALTATPYVADLLEARANEIDEQGDAVGEIAVYKQLRQIDPTQATYLTSLAYLYQISQHQEIAEQLYRRALALQPQDGGICSSLADILRENGKKKEALPLLRTAILLNPSDVDLREKEEMLAGEKPVIDLAAATPGDPILKQAKTLQANGESAVYLLDEGREVVYPDYATVTRYHEIVKVFDGNAVKRFTQFSLSRDTSSSTVTVETARLYTADGKVQDVARGAPNNTVSFPSLAPGDVIDVSYRVEDYQRGGLAHQFWGAWYIGIPLAPVELSRFVLITPTSMEFRTQAHGDVPAPATHDMGAWRIREWTKKGIPGVKIERLSPAWNDVNPWIDFSTVDSWDRIVRWYRDLSGPLCIPDAAVKAKARELTKDLKTDDEKLRAIVAFVRKIQYQSTPFRLSAYIPTEGKQVLRERYADCKDKAALLTALLGAVGIKSDMVLLNPREYGVTPCLPSPRFAHAIARVQTKDGPLWVDATAEDMAFGELPDEDQQTPALVIDDMMTDISLTPALPAERSGEGESITGALSADGRLSVSTEETAMGNEAWLLRSVMKVLPENQIQPALRSMTSGMGKGSEYESGNIENIGDPEKPIIIRLKYHTDDYASPAGSFLLFKLPWSAPYDDDTLSALQATPERSYDVELADQRGRHTSLVRIELPAGYVPQDLSPEVKIESPYGAFTFTYKMDGGVLDAQLDGTLTSFRIDAKEAGKYVDFLKSLQKEAEKQIVLKRQ